MARRARPSHYFNAVIFNVQPARLPGREGAAENQVSLGREMTHIISAYILLARGRSMGPARDKWAENDGTWLESHDLTVTIPYGRGACIFGGGLQLLSPQHLQRLTKACPGGINQSSSQQMEPRQPHPDTWAHLIPDSPACCQLLLSSASPQGSLYP